MSNQIKNFRDLEVWKRGVAIVMNCYSLTNQFPKTEVYALSNQIQRSAISIPSNIAEGWARGTSKEYSRFIDISRGSLAELETQLFIAKELGYGKPEEIEKTINNCDELAKMLNVLSGRIKAKFSKPALVDYIP